ncbi:MAG TPA: lamin tail domain-containing protein [Methylomirabilota bacterium]|nr:lamin tail domain-containing protein [Methylomirabilota bacterium]
MINEWLAHTDDPQLDYIELHNRGRQPVNLSGAYLSDDRDTNKFRIPDNTILGPGGFIAFDQSQLGFALSSGGERIYLVNSNQTRVIDLVSFDGSANGVASGRFPDGAPTFHELSAQTPGAANAGLLLRDIVINEIMYNPISGDDDDEYVELHNRGAVDVNVGGWRFVDGVSFTIPPGTIIPAGGYLVVARDRDRLQARYAQLNATNTVGNYSGTLANGGERLALAMPDYFTVTNNNVVVTQAVYIVVDEVVYDDGGRWGEWSDGGGSSLELIDPASDNRLAPNWADSDETLKAPWTTVEHTGVADNGNGAFNEVHIMILGRGECLVDDVEVRAAGGPNLVANSTFDTGTAGWILGGNHDLSRPEPAGPGSPTPSLRIRATSGGDNGANRIESDLTQAPSANATVTLRARFRWLRGHPDVLVRVHGNWVEAPGTLTVPTNLGTPGLPNSRRVANAGPAIHSVVHSPVLPAVGEAVAVTARVYDPDGVAFVNLRYRVDPSPTFSTTPMNDAGTGADLIAGDGVYTGLIPAQNSTNLVAFHIVAQDAASTPASTTFPERLSVPPAFPLRECYVRWGETTPFGAFGVYRLWMPQTNISRWIAREKMSNQALDGTLVYGGWRVIYNAGGRYRGSPFIRPGYTTPLAGNVAYVWSTPNDDVLLGADELNLDSLEPTTGTGNQRDGTALREPISFWMAGELGLSFSYQRFVHLHINGVTSRSRGIPVYADTQQPDAAYISSWFGDDPEGEIFKIDDWFEFNDSTVPDREFNENAVLANFTTPVNGLPVKDQGRYRWSWEKKFNGTLNDDYSRLFDLVDAINSSTNIVNEALEAVIESEPFFTALMLRHAVGDWDGYGYDRGKNQFIYAPARGKIWMLLWDLDFALGCNSGHPPTQNMFQVNDPVMGRIYNLPHFRRICLRAMRRMVDGPFLPANYGPVIATRYNAFVANGVVTTSPYVNSGAQNISIPAWIDQRRANLLGAGYLGAVPNVPFAVNAPALPSSPTNVITITGTGPLDVRDVLLNGVRWPVYWHSLTGWTARVVLEAGTNTLEFAGRNSDGVVITSTQRVAVEYTGPVTSPVGAVVLNEIGYSSVTPRATFVEILNKSSAVHSLSGWRLNGLGYTFPPGSFINPGQYLILTEDRQAFARTYGTNVPVFAEFTGRLDLDGETLTLIKPGATEAEDVIVDRVRYESRAPWSTAASGGASLQLIDNDEDNTRPSNWQGGLGWTRVTRTGNILNATNLLLSLQVAGSAYIDDITLTDSEGNDIVLNGGFETGDTVPWIIPSNYGQSVVTDAVSHSGRYSFLIQGSGGGSQLATSIQQWLAGRVISNAIYTLSFWTLPHTNSTQVNLRTLPGNNLATNAIPRAVYGTPGTVNFSVAADLPAYDPLWLNELQADNAAGPTDNAGEREPWIELYNSGNTELSLEGYFLADTYTGNLTQWAFPAGSTIAPGEFKVIWADGEPQESTPTHWHTSFRLNSATGTVALVRLVNNQPQITDYLTYSGLRANLSYGDYPDGQIPLRRTFQTVTPGAPNASRDVNIFINEWMAGNTTNSMIFDPADGRAEDWFELYNAGDAAVDLGGLYLTDSLNNRTRFQIPDNGHYILGPGEFLIVWADNDSNQNSPALADLHVNFALSLSGEAIGLFDRDGQTPIDTVTFNQQTNNISQGRFADGSAALYFMTTPTPGRPNTLGDGNRAPIVTPISDKQVTIGQVLRFKVVASDSDAGQSLSYAVQSGPDGATIDGAGFFEWAPLAGAPAANPVTVRVSDNGSPSLSATRSFVVFVRAPATIAASGGGYELSFPTIPGRQYRIEFKNDLAEETWQELTVQTATGPEIIIEDNPVGQPHRFYRLVQLD